MTIEKKDNEGFPLDEQQGQPATDVSPEDYGPAEAVAFRAQVTVRTRDIWEVQKRTDDESTWQPLLEDGWEPYAVAAHDFGTMVFFRRLKTVISDMEVEHDYESGEQESGTQPEDAPAGDGRTGEDGSGE